MEERKKVIKTIYGYIDSYFKDETQTKSPKMVVAISELLKMLAKF